MGNSDFITMELKILGEETKSHKILQIILRINLSFARSLNDHPLKGAIWFRPGIERYFTACRG